MLYVFSHDTDTTGSLAVKLDTGFPDIGAVELPLGTLPQVRGRIGSAPGRLICDHVEQRGCGIEPQ